MGSMVELSDLPPPTDPTCMDCTRKHLSQASVLMDEARQGYPLHRWMAIGHLAEAARESHVRFPAFGEKLRVHRHLLQNEPKYLVPFLALIDEANKLAEGK